MHLLNVSTLVQPLLLHQLPLLLEDEVEHVRQYPVDADGAHALMEDGEFFRGDDAAQVELVEIVDDVHVPDRDDLIAEGL